MGGGDRGGGLGWGAWRGREGGGWNAAARNRRGRNRRPSPRARSSADRAAGCPLARSDGYVYLCVACLHAPILVTVRLYRDYLRVYTCEVEWSPAPRFLQRLHVSVFASYRRPQRPPSGPSRRAVYSESNLNEQRSSRLPPSHAAEFHCTRQAGEIPAAPCVRAEKGVRALRAADPPSRRFETSARTERTSLAGFGFSLRS